jgi:hypothetical protein
MTPSPDIDRYLDMDPFEGLQAAWAAMDLPLGERSRLVSRLTMKSRLSLEGAARICDASPAEVQALLNLATLDDEDLEMVSRADPPATTWFLFAAADSDWIRAGVEALKTVPNEEPVLRIVYEAMRLQSGPDLDERIAAISGETLGHLSHKAKEYGKLSPKARSFLVDLAKKKRVGVTLTEKQLNWLKSILFELVESGVVCSESPDSDQEVCDEVLAALGM